jgi:hypothetical protein
MIAPGRTSLSPPSSRVRRRRILAGILAKRSGWTAGLALGLLIIIVVGGGACGGAGAGAGLNRAPESGPRGPSGPAGTASAANLAGARCQGASCTCRKRDGKPAETPPPDADHKRFEIRVGAEDGYASVESPTLGKFNGGGHAESCFYIDVLPGTSHEVTFTAQEGKPEAGVSPTLSISEYGPKGPYWYDVLAVRCAGAGGKCTRDAAEEWGADAKNRRRGRIDPCGSSVITHLEWETSGGMADRDTGFFRDFTVSFNMEVKKFATQFAPGSTECVPK